MTKNEVKTSSPVLLINGLIFERSRVNNRRVIYYYVFILAIIFLLVKRNRIEKRKIQPCKKKIRAITRRKMIFIRENFNIKSNHNSLVSRRFFPVRNSAFILLLSRVYHFVFVFYFTTAFYFTQNEQSERQYFRTFRRTPSNSERFLTNADVVVVVEKQTSPK